jgi:hypothetical protein
MIDDVSLCSAFAANFVLVSHAIFLSIMLFLPLVGFLGFMMNSLSILKMNIITRYGYSLWQQMKISHRLRGMCRIE